MVVRTPRNYTVLSKYQKREFEKFRQPELKREEFAAGMIRKLLNYIEKHCCFLLAGMNMASVFFKNNEHSEGSYKSC